MPERRCIVTGEPAPIESLLRFVIGPEGEVVPDLARELPGRGIWLGCRRELVRQAVAKRLFARAAKQPVRADDGLPDLVEAGLRRRCLGLLGLAKRAGELTLGFEKVRILLAGEQAMVVVWAHDASARGREKLLGARAAAGSEGSPLGPAVIGLFGVEELSLALGRENVVHAALHAGGLAQRFVRECRRLADYCG